MLHYPNAKINLGLYILRKRKDGYHAIESGFYPLRGLYEALEFIESESDSLQIEGMDLDVGMEGNIVYRALQELRKLAEIPPQQIVLQKAIPSGAGLGGGSADAAWTLKALREKYGDRITDEQIEEIALQLGSDVPYFLKNSPAVAQGQGEILKPIDLDLSGYQIRCVHPAVHINTAWAYSQAKPKDNRKPIASILAQDIVSWRKELFNDFEDIVFEKHPQLKKVKDRLYAEGAIYASMSGSGSSFYGIFPS